MAPIDLNATVSYIAITVHVVGVLFITVFGLGLLLRGASFYGSLCGFLKNVLAWLSFVYFVITVIAVILELVAFYILHESPYLLDIKIFGNILFAIDLCWYYIAIIYRVYISFKNNIEYKLSRSELIGSAILVATPFCTVTFVSVYIFYDGVDAEAFEIMIVIIICVDISFNLILLYMLLKRLYRMIVRLDDSFEKLIVNVEQIRMDTIDATVEQSQSESELMMEENRNRMEKNRINQTEIVNMMAKVSLLTIISLIFMNMYFAGVIYALFAFENQTNQDLISVYDLVLRIEFIIGLCWNCFTLYATFPFNDKQYIKCCILCHKGLKNCCVVCVTKQMFWQRHRG